MNAKTELLKAQGNKTIAWAKISHRHYHEDSTHHVLKPESKYSYYAKFMNSLDFIYDAGYGSQELFGEVMFTDGTWLERDEYDGSENWRLVEKPNYK